MRSSSPSVSRRGPPGARDRAVHPAVREGADDGVGELGLERRDLAAQLRAGRALVGDDADVADVEHGRESTVRHGRPKAPRRSRTAPPRRAARAPRAPRRRTAAAARSGDLGARPGATSPKSTATGPAASATTTRPGAEVGGVLALPQALAGLRAAQPQRPVQARVVQRPYGDAGLDHGHQQGVLQRPARDEASLDQAIERRRLHRRALRIGIEADVAEEDAVGRRDRLAAQGQRAGAVEAVGQQRQALAQRARGAAPGRRRDDRDDPQLGELERQLAIDPALLQRRVRAGHGPILMPRDSRSSAVRRRSSSAPSSSPTLVACTTPPASA